MKQAEPLRFCLFFSAVPDFFVYLARILIIYIAGYLAAHGAEDPVGTVVVSFVAAVSFSSTFSLTFVVTHLLETFAAADRHCQDHAGRPRHHRYG